MVASSSDKLPGLSAEQCLLLAVQHASESDIASLRTLFSLRSDVLPPKLALRCLLTYLPETAEPDIYTGLVDAVGNGTLSSLDQHTAVDTSAVASLSPAKAKSKAKKLQLLDLLYPSFAPDEYPEPLIQFLIHRSHRIEEQTGFLSLVPQLLDPFLDRYASLRTWFVSSVLPILRFQYEFYPEATFPYGLSQVELADETQGPTIWLSQAFSEGESRPREHSAENHLARDLRSLVGPWARGGTARKRRKLNKNAKEDSSTQLRKDSSSATSAWTGTFQYLVDKAVDQLAPVAQAVQEWNGPADVDLGGYEDSEASASAKSSEERDLYHQTALAIVYASESSDDTTLSSSWGVLLNLAAETGTGALLEGEPHDLRSQMNALEELEPHRVQINEMVKSNLVSDVLLQRGHPLTTFNDATLNLSKHFVLSSSLLAEFGYPVAVVNGVKIKHLLDKDEQASVLEKIIHILTSSSKKSETEWLSTRTKILWLWGWGDEGKNAETGSGLFGKIPRSTLEKEILEALVSSGCYNAASAIYIRGEQSHPLQPEQVEQVIISAALQQYDNASNGNRTRGAMKKASEIVGSFSKHYPKSPSFPRLQALLSATHAMSSYSLTLQHGVPFQPVSIRVSSDPLSLIEKILAQNQGSYIKIQDLVSIGTNLVAAGLTDQSHDNDPSSAPSPAEFDRQKKSAQRRVIGMAIEAALNEDDFETAYSYVVNWLDTSSVTETQTDNIAWRAALAAGKHKSTSFSIRRLEQRMELLSQALLLAPPSALTEVLSAWRKCEEEMGALLAAESAAESEDFDDQNVPGAFVDATAPVQARREVGRGANEEAPMGLFDVARGAAVAFSRSAFPLRGGANVERQVKVVEAPVSEAGSDEGRVRRRDMVASAVTGGLASGIGWVLGATPQNPPR